MKSANNSYMKYHHGLHYDYPSDIHGHMIDPKQTRKDTLNKEYPYYRKDFWYNVGRVIIEFILMTVGVIFVKLKFGLKVYNKKNRKILKKMIKKKKVSSPSLIIFMMKTMSPLEPRWSHIWVISACGKIII